MKKLLILLPLALAACTVPTPAPNPEPSGSVEVGMPVVVQPVDSLDQAALAACAAHSWKDRGKAPRGLIDGQMRAFGRSVCRFMSQDVTVAGVTGQDLGSSSTDALALYGLDAKTGLDRLRLTYALGYGLAMRESSGKYCEGRDTTAGAETADTAEAGPFQASYNSRGASLDRLNGLWAWYKAHPASCDLELWQQGASSTSKDCSLNAVGDGPGQSWQVMTRACPAFASEWAMTLLRTLRKHFGPINRKEAELFPACDDLLVSVQAQIMAKPALCNDLL